MEFSAEPPGLTTPNVPFTFTYGEEVSYVAFPPDVSFKAAVVVLSAYGYLEIFFCKVYTVFFI